MDTIKTKTSLYSSPLLWALGTLLFVYVGTEVGTGSWSLLYVERATSLGASNAALVASGYWLALTCGRVIGAVLGTRLQPRTLLGLCLGGVAFSTLALALSGGNAVVIVTALLLMPLCEGPVYPTMLALVAHLFREGPSRATGLVMALGSAGGAVLPWLQGLAIAWAGPYAGLSLVAASAALMAAVYAGTLALSRTRTSAPLPGDLAV